MTEGKGICAAGDSPVAKLTTLEKVFEGDGLSRFYYRSCGLLSEACFIVSFVWAEHWQVIIQHVYCHVERQCAYEVLYHCCVVGHFGAVSYVDSSERC